MSVDDKVILMSVKGSRVHPSPNPLPLPGSQPKFEVTASQVCQSKFVNQNSSSRTCQRPLATPPPQPRCCTHSHMHALNTQPHIALPLAHNLPSQLATPRSTHCCVASCRPAFPFSGHSPLPLLLQTDVHFAWHLVRYDAYDIKRRHSLSSGAVIRLKHTEKEVSGAGSTMGHTAAAIAYGTCRTFAATSVCSHIRQWAGVLQQVFVREPCVDRPT